MANPNGNINNLDPVQSTEEAKKRGRNGGIASGKARRKKASLMRCAQRVLEADIPKEIRQGVEKMVGKLDDEHDELFTAAVAVMAKEAIGGNTSAFAQLKDMVQNMDAAYIEDHEEEDELSRSLRELGESL